MIKVLRKPSAAQTITEELFNAFTHGLGIVLSIIALVALFIPAYNQGDPLKIISSIVYGLSLVTMYTASTLYHSFKLPHIKQALRVFDHSSIYVLIAGTYTPFTLVTLHGAWGWTLFGIIWGLAIAGVLFKLFFTGRFNKLSLAIYLLMGWLVVIAIKPFIAAMPTGGLVWLALGGLCYTVGVIFYILDGKYYLSHALWHLFVLGGSICQFFAVLYYVI